MLKRRRVRKRVSLIPFCYASVYVAMMVLYPVLVWCYYLCCNVVVFINR